jgi:hypothetical protein
MRAKWPSNGASPSNGVGPGSNKSEGTGEGRAPEIRCGFQELLSPLAPSPYSP